MTSKTDIEAFLVAIDRVFHTDAQPLTRHPDRDYARLYATLSVQKEHPSRGTATFPGAPGVQFRFFGGMLSGNLCAFPLLTAKFVSRRAVFGELLWFLKGGTNTQQLRDHGISIWDEWARPDGSLGPVYGHQWRFGGSPGGEDQIRRIVGLLESNPYDRRMVVEAFRWSGNVAPALPTCHTGFQLVAREYPHGAAVGVDLCVTQRSADVFLGVPYNIASYAMLNHILCGWANVARESAGAPLLYPRNVVLTFGDLHLYVDHVQAASAYLKRVARGDAAAQPTIDRAAIAAWCAETKESFIGPEAVLDGSVRADHLQRLVDTVSYSVPSSDAIRAPVNV